ncbi:cytochrome b/b6 domain-containing protein [Streptomyces sp. NPDC017988]|uniref:cytochrome b/b6 domain-containing protein n=1 Tax=Streptomyces sp. NPDC017988 TaxID=3365025 RepID=UPI00379376B1
MNPLHPHRQSRLLGAGALLLIPLLVVAGSDGFRAALDFTTGVLCLVSLTAAVLWGLVATDRLFLRSRQRLLAQAVHRATAVASVGFLLLHGTVKIALDHVSLLGALVPFGLGVSGSAGLIGLGSLAGLLMVATSVTGALRSAFASPARIASRWRALHMLAYPAWCAALIHGLYAGRPPKPWVIALYALCLLGVAGAVALRAAPPPVKRKVAARVLALLEPEPGTSRRDHPRARDTASSPLPGTAADTAPAPGPTAGIWAAYRALTPTPPQPPRPTGPPPRAEPTDRWPTPSPPPPAEAPYVAPRPTYDTASQPLCTPAYEPAPMPTYEPAHTPVHESTHDRSYEPVHDPAYDSGHATEPLPRPFQAPSSGEPWNAATGGHP